MRNVTTGGTRLTFPNLTSYVNSRYSYVKFERLVNPTANQDVKLSIDTAGQHIELNRKTDANGITVFPLSGILAALCGEAPFLYNVMLEISSADWSLGLGVVYVINGFSDREIDPVSTATTPSLWPQGDRMVVYPKFTSALFVPAVNGSDITISNDNGKYSTSFPSWEVPFVYFLVDDRWGEDSDIIHVDVTYNNKTTQLLLPVDVDRCQKGIFLKWTDKYGIPRLYRWSLGSRTDEASVEDTYLRLDENLNPFSVQNRTLTTTYNLHSRMVPQAVYDLCSSIITAQQVEMLHPETKKWERCTIEESEVTDNGQLQKDLIIDVSIKEYNL